MLKSRLFAALTAIALALPGIAAHAADVKLNTTADHGKFKELQREFTSGPEVTKACLTCHTEAASQIHRTKHWTWEVVNPLNNQKLGKKERHQQLLPFLRNEHGGLRDLPRRLRLGQFELRLQVAGKRRLPGLP